MGAEADVDAVAAGGLVESGVCNEGARALTALASEELDPDGVCLALLERAGRSVDGRGGEEERDDAGELHGCGWSLVGWLESRELV